MRREVAGGRLGEGGGCGRPPHGWVSRRATRRPGHPCGGRRGGGAVGERGAARCGTRHARRAHGGASSAGGNEALAAVVPCLARRRRPELASPAAHVPLPAPPPGLRPRAARVGGRGVQAGRPVSRLPPPCRRYGHASPHSAGVADAHSSRLLSLLRQHVHVRGGRGGGEEGTAFPAVPARRFSPAAPPSAAAGRRARWSRRSGGRSGGGGGDGGRTPAVAALAAALTGRVVGTAAAPRCLP